MRRTSIVPIQSPFGFPKSENSTTDFLSIYDVDFRMHEWMKGKSQTDVKVYNDASVNKVMEGRKGDARRHS